MNDLLMTFGILLLYAFVFTQLIIGCMGLEYHIGVWGMVAVLIGSFVFRSSLFITIGVFFGVVDVIGWHWSIGVIIAMPGLVFVAPAILAILVDTFGPKLNKIKMFFSTSSEISAVLDAIATVRYEYASNDMRESVAAGETILEATKRIKRDKVAIADFMKHEGRRPTHMALTIIFNISKEALSFGRYHVYRGVLSPEGLGYLYVYKKTLELLEEKGFMDEDDVELNLDIIRRNIKEVG